MAKVHKYVHNGKVFHHLDSGEVIKIEDVQEIEWITNAVDSKERANSNIPGVSLRNYGKSHGLVLRLNKKATEEMPDSMKLPKALIAVMEDKILIKFLEAKNGFTVQYEDRKTNKGVCIRKLGKEVENKLVENGWELPFYSYNMEWKDDILTIKK